MRAIFHKGNGASISSIMKCNLRGITGSWPLRLLSDGVRLCRALDRLGLVGLNASATTRVISKW